MSITLTTSRDRNVLVADQAERRQAHDLLEKLDGHPERLMVGARGGRKRLPNDLAIILGKVIEAMARGGTITIRSLPDELTTTVAAELLGISRPTLMKMIDRGEIAAHRVGSHHRLKSADVLAFQRKRLERQRRAFDDLRELEDQLDRT